jgi:hypothetical protein
LEFVVRKATLRNYLTLTTMKTSAFLLLIFFSITVYGQLPPAEEQIAAAVLAASSEQRDGATVYGFDADGNLIKLRQGTNELICLADNPFKKGFEVDCYHKDLEPFMARSRELRAQGKTNAEIFDIKEEEVKAGKLKMPNHDATLQVLSGPDGKYNPETGEVENANYRYVIYVPYATQESTGLPIKPVVFGGPWLMNPGTHRAHVMIGPPPNMRR